jgi:hypothetical protein
MGLGLIVIAYFKYKQNKITTSYVLTLCSGIFIGQAIVSLFEILTK